MTVLLAAALLALAAYFLYVQTRKPAKFPPGPPRIPIVGSLPFLTKPGKPGGPKLFLHGMLQNADAYGSVFGFWVGNERTVALTDYRTIREVLKSPDSASRVKTTPFNETRPLWRNLRGTMCEGVTPGVTSAVGRFWQEQKRFLLKTLRDFGFGRKGMEELIKDNAEELVIHLRKGAGQPVALQSMFHIAVVNALMMILLGKQFKLDDPEATKASNSMLDFMKMSEELLLPVKNFLPHPRMLLLPGVRQLSGYDKMKASFGTLAAFLNKFLEEHDETLDPENVRDFTDLFLAEVRKTKDPTSSFYKEVGRCYALNNLIDMFFAGSHTTSTSLHWTFLYLMHHPEAKEKVQKEIDEVCTTGSSPSLDDRANLPYTMAVLHESLRLSCLLPFSVPHMAAKDIPVGRYVIPEGTTILPSLVSIMRDPGYFKDPDAFRPERFLASDGRFQSCERVIPFSVGKRSCLGQALAEQEYFLFFASVVKHFDFQLAPMEDLPPYSIREDARDGAVRAPPDFKLIFSRR